MAEGTWARHGLVSGTRHPGQSWRDPNGNKFGQSTSITCSKVTGAVTDRERTLGEGLGGGRMCTIYGFRRIRTPKPDSLIGQIVSLI